MLRTGFSILFIFIFILSKAQNDSVNKFPGNHLSIKLSSSSSVIYPGISTGVEFPFHRVKASGLIMKSPTRSYYKNRLIAGNLSWYHHPGFHDNIYLTAEWVMRRTKPGGFISEFSAGPGLSRTFLAGTAYEVDNNGRISIDRHAGYYYALIIFGGGLGYDFSMKKQVPVSVFSRLNFLSMFPYNSTIYFRPVLELGIHYSPCPAEESHMKKN